MKGRIQGIFVINSAAWLENNFPKKTLGDWLFLKCGYLIGHTGVRCFQPEPEKEVLKQQQAGY